MKSAALKVSGEDPSLEDAKHKTERASRGALAATLIIETPPQPGPGLSS
jgi:hypothetical protein